MSAAALPHRRISVGYAALLLLTAAGVFTVGIGLARLVRGLDLGFMFLISCLAILVGWALALPRLRTGYALGLLALAGFAAVALTAGELASKLAALGWAFATTRTDLPAWLAGVPPDFTAARLALDGAASSAAAEGARIAAWTAATQAGRAAFDPLIPRLTWGWAVWLCAGWCGRALRRGLSQLAALGPGILLMAGSYGFTRFDPLPVVFLFGWLLVSSILAGQVRRERSWGSRGIDFSTEIRFDLAVAAAPLALLVIGAAGILPFIPWDKLFEIHPAGGLPPAGQAEPVIKSFGLSLPTRLPDVLDSYTFPGMPRAHLVGMSPQLRATVVMTARLVAGSQPESKLYWREFTYDRYLGNGWGTGPVSTQKYPAKAVPYPPGTAAQAHAQFELNESRELQGLLITPGQLVTADHDFTLQARQGGDLFGGYLDTAFYRVEAVQPRFSPEALRAAGTAYPDWVRQGYLQLPDSVSNRVISLSHDLTATATNPYDRAKAIEKSLHTFPYSLDLPAPPAGREIADYFLFDLKKGYCDYFSTAMVVLARAAGIPARLVVGYAPGQYDPSSQRIILREANAHSWPELYFPSYGWVDFEPTPGIGSEGNRQYDEPQPLGIPTSAGGADPVGSLLTHAARNIPWKPLLAAGLALVAFLLIGSYLRSRRILRLAPQSGVQVIFASLLRMDPPDPCLTPYEAGDRIAGSLRRMAGIPWIGRWFASGGEEIAQLASSYVRSSYSPRPVGRSEFLQAARSWQKLRVRLRLARWLRFGMRLFRIT